MLPWTRDKLHRCEGKTVDRVLMVVTDETFGRNILRAAVPAVVLFRSQACAASAALMPLLNRFAAAYAERLLVASVDVDDEPMIASQYNIEATPSLIVFQDGEPTGWLLGFAAEGLLERFFAEVGAGRQQGFWRPTEEVFEEAVIIPLIERWGWRFLRQSGCSLKIGRRASRGRIDFLVFADDTARPLTLFENKRLLLGERAAQAAALQAQGYAEALGLSSFVVAAPAGMWVYTLHAGRTALARAFSSLDIYVQPDTLRTLLLQLGSVPQALAQPPTVDRPGPMLKERL